MRALRPRLIALFAALLALPALLFAAAPAQAQDAYLYWSFWEQSPSGQWTFVETGAGDVIPANGAVDGWRFGLSGVDAASARTPRSNPTFAEICGTEPAPAGQKKVAEVIDTGTTADAPSGSTPPAPLYACATVAENANAMQALQAVTQTRVEGAIICSINGYPASGCGETAVNVAAIPTDNPADFVAPQTLAAPAQSTQQSSGAPIGLIIAGIAVVALIIVAIVVSRRRKS